MTLRRIVVCAIVLALLASAPTLAQGAEAPLLGLTAPSASVRPGETANASLNVTNPTLRPMFVEFSAGNAPAGVNVTFEPPTIQLLPSATARVNVSAQTAGGTPLGNHSITLVALDTSPGGVEGNITWFLHVIPWPALHASPSTVTRTLGANESATFEVMLTHSGNATANVTISKSASAGWNVAVSPSTFALAPSSNRVVTITLTTNETAQNGAGRITFAAAEFLPTDIDLTLQRAAAAPPQEPPPTPPPADPPVESPPADPMPAPPATGSAGNTTGEQESGAGNPPANNETEPPNTPSNTTEQPTPNEPINNVTEPRPPAASAPNTTRPPQDTPAPGAANGPDTPSEEPAPDNAPETASESPVPEPITPPPTIAAIRVDPQELTIAPGQSATGRLIITNPLETPWRIDARFTLPDAVWVSEDPPIILVPPGATVNLSFALDATIDAIPGGLARAIVTVDDATAEFRIRIGLPPNNGPELLTLAARAPDPTPWLAILLGTGGAAILALAATRKRWTLLIAALYARIAPARVLEHPVRAALVDLVSTNPGVTLSEVQRALEIGNGALAYHVRTLERAGHIVLVPHGQQRRIYVRGQTRAVPVAPAADRILALVQSRGGTLAAELARELGMSKQVAHYHLKRLTSQGVLSQERTPDGIRVQLGPRVRS